MWYEEEPYVKSWARLWSGYILCACCHGIRTTSGVCPACGDLLGDPQWVLIRMEDGKERAFPPVYAGAEGRYEDWVYLRMLQREWARPLADSDLLHDIPERSRPSPRAAIVLLFWTYFETRIDRLFRQAIKGMPGSTGDDLLRRYSVVGSRVDRLYRIMFESTYWRDLVDIGQPGVAALLQRTQDARNRFAHGEPSAIDDELVQALVTELKNEHEAWIAVFNRRAARISQSI